MVDVAGGSYPAPGAASRADTRGAGAETAGGFGGFRFNLFWGVPGLVVPLSGTALPF